MLFLGYWNLWLCLGSIAVAIAVGYCHIWCGFVCVSKCVLCVCMCVIVCVNLHVYMHVCLCVCMYTCRFAVWMYACMCTVFVHMCVHVCVWVCWMCFWDLLCLFCWYVASYKCEFLRVFFYPCLTNFRMTFYMCVKGALGECCPHMRWEEPLRPVGHSHQLWTSSHQHIAPRGPVTTTFTPFLVCLEVWDHLQIVLITPTTSGR